MSKYAPRLTADSVSAGIVTGAVLGWLINVIDLGLLRPFQLNLARLLAGLEPLPFNYGPLLTREIAAFNRWWLVITIAVAATAYTLYELRKKPLSPRKWIWLPLLGAWVLTAAIYELYYVPTAMQALWEWLTRFAMSVIVAPILRWGLLPCVRLSVRRFSEEQ